MSTVNETDPLVGRVLDGRYEIVSRIDRGGMATVYKAIDQRLTRTVAVKVMHESLGGDAEFVARFDREARAAAGLSHPNVVSVFDQGMDQGRPYIVMEYVPGKTLRKVIFHEGPMAPQRALDLLIPIVSAVAAAHEMGIIHRDLKPENVLISDRNQTKVADFGLARAVTAHTATTAGTVIGSVSYLAPELVTAGKGSTRSDVYALGVILYEMLTGKKPHTGESPIQVAYSHVHNDIEPPSQVNPAGHIPDYLDALVLAAANRELDARPVDAGVLLDHLLAARTAIAAGKLSDPSLIRRMQATGIDPADQPTAAVPLLGDTAVSGEEIAPIPREATPREPMRMLPVDNRPDFVPSNELVAQRPAAVATQWGDPLQTAQPLIAKQHKRRRTGLTVFLILLVVAILLGFTGWYVFKGRFVEVPDFNRLTQTKTESIATQTGVRVTFLDEYSEDVPAGQVVRTVPGVGESIERGGLVTVYLSKGQERYPVPDVVGLTVAEATVALEEGHLKLGEITEAWSEKVAVGVITGMSLKADKMVKRDTVVDVTVSKGRKPISVKDYTGKKYSDAKKALTDAGLKVKVTEEKNDKKIKEGYVISQDPKTGTLYKGDTVNFVVSKGPVMVQIPDLKFNGISAAEDKLKALGLKTKVVVSSSPMPLYIVSYTDPAAGSMVAEGSTVTIHGV